MISQVLFILLALITVASAVLAVGSRQLVHAALWLVVALGGIAGCFLLLGAELLAWVQVLVYVGAVVVLIVFALMLTRQPTGVLSAEVTKNRPVAAVLGMVAAVGMGATFIAAFGTQRIRTTGSGTATALGEAIFTHWVLAFEVLSIVLLVALIAAIAISRSEGDRPGEARD
ncbi:MAG TPA: NADH-quinone oxidoreductase subunit J [Aeromicrobium sp.]|nr:NADH-quinone oxidoreductase subunit J [Aeromicrobium sp.]